MTSGYQYKDLSKAIGNVEKPLKETLVNTIKS